MKRWRNAINSYRYSGKTGELRTVELHLQEALAECEHGSLEEIVLEASLGDRLSITGRWKGILESLEKGCSKVGVLVDLLESDPDRFERAAIAQARAWLGNALTRRAYLTRLEVHQAEAILMMESALQAWESDQAEGKDRRLLATILRDLGDAYVGLLMWVRDVSIKGESVETLRRAVKVFECLLDDASNEDRPGIEVELCAARSSLAVACMFIVEHWMDSADKVSLEFRSVESVKKLVDEATANIEEVLRVFESAEDDHVPFRWARILSNVGCASHFAWRWLEDAEEGGERVRTEARTSVEERAEQAIESASKLYDPRFQPFRLAVMQEGLGNLYRDRMMHCTVSKELRSQLGATAIGHYESAAETFSSCEGNEACDRAQECRAKCAWVEQHAQPNLTSLPGLWFDYSLWFFGGKKIDRRETKVAREEFRRAVDAAEYARTNVMRVLETEIVEAQRYPPSQTEDREAFMGRVNGALRNFNLALKVDDQFARKLRMVRSSLELVVQSGSRGFLKSKITVIHAPEERRGRKPVGRSLTAD